MGPILQGAHFLQHFLLAYMGVVSFWGGGNSCLPRNEIWLSFQVWNALHGQSLEGNLD